jgi:protein TonB
MRPIFAGHFPQSLAPSRTALGPNRYLRERDFLLMIALAVLLHLLVLALLNMMPDKKVTTIPVRSLSFKIGDAPKLQSFSAPVAISAPSPAPKATSAKNTNWRAAPKPQAKPPQEKIIEVPLPAAPTVAERQVPTENSSFFDFLTREKPPEKTPAPAVVSGETPRRYVRQYGTAPVESLSDKAQAAFAQPDAVATVTDPAAGALTSEQEIRARYEQTISAWIQQHRIYPASARGREGRAVVRVRIDRQGYVRYYALEESAGTEALDRAAVDMIRRANPVPAVPADYPAGNLIEFLIPMTFEAP